MGVLIYAVGIVNLCACAPNDMPIEEVTRRVNLLRPTEIAGQWTLADDPTFADGSPHPKLCEHDPYHTHYLFHC